MIQRYFTQDECLPEYNTKKCEYYDIKHFIKRVEDIMAKEDITQEEKAHVTMLFLLSVDVFYGRWAKGKSTEKERNRLGVVDFEKWQDIVPLSEMDFFRTLSYFIKIMCIKAEVSYNALCTTLENYENLVKNSFLSETQRIICANSFLTLKSIEQKSIKQAKEYESKIKTIEDSILFMGNDYLMADTLLSPKNCIVEKYKEVYAFNVLMDIWADLLNTPELKTLKYDISKIKESLLNVEKLLNNTIGTVLGNGNVIPLYPVGKFESKVANTYKKAIITMRNRNLRPTNYDVTRAYARFHDFYVLDRDDFDRTELESIYYDMCNGTNR